ncbi:hypothetical protein B0H19DRAFT_1229904 [Mycena capillaripes]|nr:hypothetical protein B0H19DRAFT_1229904 [Mycena capillaripes]
MTVMNPTSCTGAADSMACLRAVDVNVLATANQNILAAGLFGVVSLVPVVDGEFITQRPTLSLAEGKVNGRLIESGRCTLVWVLNCFKPTLFLANPYSYVPLTSCSVHSPAVPSSFKGEFAIPPGFHGSDIQYYFPSTAIDAPDIATAPIFNNTAFIAAFAQSFISFAISLDPNIKVNPTSLTPKWNKWEVGHTEMIFNKTEADVPLIKPGKTSDVLLERCRFWDSVGALTGQ